MNNLIHKPLRRLDYESVVAHLDKRRIPAFYKGGGLELLQRPTPRTSVSFESIEDQLSEALKDLDSELGRAA